MPTLIELITEYPTVNAFRRIDDDDEDDDALEWDPLRFEYTPEPGDVLTDAGRCGFYVLGAMNILSQTDVRRCYLDVCMPERIDTFAYIFNGRELRYDYAHKLGGEIIPTIAIDGFGSYELFYSKISPGLGIDVLRRGLNASPRKRYIAQDLGYILRDEGRYRESAAMFQIAVDEGVSSYFIYKELTELYRRIGDTEKQKHYSALFEAARGGA
jgi:hypothetical protein